MRRKRGRRPEMARRAAMVGLLILGLLLGGCWDRTELEDQAYIVTLGVDRRETGKLLVTARVAVSPAVMGRVTGGLGGARGVASKLISAEGETLNKALHVLNAATSRRLDLRHLRALILGEELSRAGVEPLLMEVMRHPALREGATLIQARGRALDVMHMNLPMAETNPAKQTEAYVMLSRYLHMAPPMYIQKFMARMVASGGDPMLPVMGINPRIGPRQTEPAESGGGSAIAGEMPRAGGDPVEFAGTAIFRHDQLVGYLTMDETQMLLALRAEMGKAYISFPDPEAPERLITMRFHQENLPKYRIGLEGGRPWVSVHLLLEGELLAAPSGIDYVNPEERIRLEAAASRFATSVIRGILDKTRRWEADPVGFGHLFRRRFLTWPEWQAYEWSRHIKDLKVDVTVQMRVRRFGLMTGPDQVKGVR